jgi:hypothetical protein
MRKFLISTIMLFCLNGVYATMAAEKILLRVEPAPAAAKGYPVSTGIPFARGTLKDIKIIRLLDESGMEIPCQVRQLAKWDAGGGV